MFPPLSRHSTDETRLIDIWQLFCITALIILARIMNLLQNHICHISISLVSVFGNAREDKNSVLLKSGNIPYPISISEEERGLVLSSTILQYFYKQKTLNILFWQMRLRSKCWMRAQKQTFNTQRL